MTQSILIPLFLMASLTSFAKGTKSLQDEHSSIYTKRVIRVLNAINVGDYPTETEYQAMLNTACNRNNCSSQEKQTIKLLGQEIVHCKIKHLKSHGIDNSDATNICESKQPIFGCDTLATALLRKMCYTGNKYNLQVLKMKELKMKQRMPASKSQ